MHDIVLIESFQTNAKNDIIVTAIVEDMVYVPGSRTHIDPPEYAPARCTITVPNDHLPAGLNLDDATEEELSTVETKNRNKEIESGESVTRKEADNSHGMGSEKQLVINNENSGTSHNNSSNNNYNISRLVVRTIDVTLNRMA